MSSEPKVFYASDTRDMFLILIGRITAVQSYSLLEHLKPETQKVHDIWADLSRTEYVDSTTVGALIMLHKEMRSKNGALFLCNVSPEVIKILRSMHLDKYLRIIENPSVEELDELAMKRVDVLNGQVVPGTFVLDAHHDLCTLVPELHDRFKTLFAVLHQQIGDT